MNIHGALHAKAVGLRNWMVVHRIDILCLQETGLVGEVERQSKDLFFSECAGLPTKHGCAILIAPWITNTQLLQTSTRGCFVSVGVTIWDL